MGTTTLSFTRPLFTGVFVAICLLLPSYRRQPLPGPALPEGMESRLRQYHEKDDLAAWIYDQLQWVAQRPATRAGLLVSASGNAWRSPRSNEEIQAWLDLLVNEGYSLLMAGDIVRSTDVYTAAFQWARRHREQVEETLVLDNILKPLGNNYTRLGDYEQALFIHRKALAIASFLGDKAAMAGTYSNLANTTSNMGLPGQSLDYCRLGLVSAGRSSSLRGLLLSEQADALRELGQIAAARESIQHSIAVLQRALTIPRSPDPETGYWLLMAYQQAGDIDSANPPAALRYYRQALALQTRLATTQGAGRIREKAKLFQRLGSLYFRTHRTDRAIYWLDQCLSVLIPGRRIDSLQETDLYAENTLQDLLYTRALLYVEKAQTDPALRCFRLCFATEKKLRKELITGPSRERAISDSRMRHETAIRTAWDAWEQTGRSSYRTTILEFMESSKSQLLLDEVQELLAHPAGGTDDSLQNRIRLLERAMIYYQKEALQTGQNDSLKAVGTAQQKQIEWDLVGLRKKVRGRSFHPSGRDPLSPPGSNLLPPPPGDPILLLEAPILPLADPRIEIRSFFVGAKALYIIALDRNGIRFVERQVPHGQWQDSIRGFLHAFFEEGPDKMINQPRAYFRQAYTIYRQIFGNHPLEPGKKYILLPDDVLSLLPVEALVTQPGYSPSPANWPFVLRQAQVSYGWSLQTLRQQFRTPGNPKGFSGFFLSDNTRHLPSLKAIAMEKEGVASSVRNGEWYTDSQATFPAFREALQQSSVVHISSHAFSSKETLNIPHIELYDQPFYLFQLADLERHPCLVVLSACRTGDGRMVTGEGVQSLARAFTAGGANAVVAGWWNVNDEVAAQLMQRFYRSLMTEQQAATALHGSKLDWVDDPAVPYLHKLPYYWAALNYQGSPAPLGNDFFQLNGRNQTRKTLFGWWLAGLLLLASAALVLLTRRSTLSPGRDRADL